jgi:integration host factor subunit alpha
MFLTNKINSYHCDKKAPTLTKDSLIKLVTNKSSISSTKTKTAVSIALEEMKSTLEKKTEVKISKFGKWTIKEKKIRPGRNPHTGEKINITARSVVIFRPSIKLKETINIK